MYAAERGVSRPRLDEIQVNGTAIGGAIAITGLVTLLFALAPALATSRVELQDALRSGSRQSGVGRRRRLGTEALVVGQIALALLVLSAAGLITHSLMKLERVELAFEPSRRIAVRHDLGLCGCWVRTHRSLRKWKQQCPSRAR